MYKRHTGLVIGVLLGTVFGAFTHWWLSKPQGPQPIPEFRDDIIAEIDAVNRSVDQADKRPIPTSSVDISFTDSDRFYLADGTLKPGGLSNFTGRIVGFNGRVPDAEWEQRPGEGADMSLYFHAGKLYCVDTYGQNRRYMIEAGQLRQVVDYNWTRRSPDNGLNTPSGDHGEHPMHFYRFSSSGELTHYGRINKIRMGNSDWDPDGKRWNLQYRYDVYYHDGEAVVKLQTGPHGELHYLHYRHADGQTSIGFRPDGRIAYQIDECSE